MPKPYTWDDPAGKDSEGDGPPDPFDTSGDQPANGAAGDPSDAVGVDAEPTGGDRADRSTDAGGWADDGGWASDASI